MPRFSSGFGKKKPLIEIVNKDFLPSRNDFNTNKVDIDLKRGKVKEVTFYSEDVKYSLTNGSLKFTNFISDIRQQDKINAMTNFASDISIIKENIEVATSLQYNERMLSILSLYLLNETSNISKQLMKSDVRGKMEVQDGLRVYWYLDTKMDQIRIVCIDPQHLVLPSMHKGIDKNTVMKETYNNTVNSKKHCISSYFKK